MKKILKSVFVIIGTIIGAGFISGKEVYIFFSVYGFNGVIGIILSTILLFIVIWRVLDIVKEKNITEYSKLDINSPIRHIMTIFLLTTFYIMIAGLAAFLQQEFGISIIVGSIISTLICYVTLKKGVNGIVKINVLLIPMLLAVIIYTCYNNVNHETIKTIIQSNNLLSIKNNIKLIINAIEYVSYNSIILIPILISLDKNKSRNKNIVVGAISAIVFGIITFGIHILLTQFSQEQLQLEIPIIAIINNYGRLYKCIFKIVIIIAIYTSAISAGYGFVKSINSGEKYIVMICVSSVFISLIRFSHLVQILYPVFGVLGIFQLYKIIFKSVKVNR